MEFRASHNYARISAPKVRNVAELIRGKHVNDALQILRMTPKRASYFLDKVLRSAIANADESLEADMEKLWVKDARVESGPMRRRWRAGPRGRAMVERRRTSHISILLDDRR